MATYPIPRVLSTETSSSLERPMSREEGWALIVSLFGSAKEMYAEVGGSDAFLRAEREAWGE